MIDLDLYLRSAGTRPIKAGRGIFLPTTGGWVGDAGIPTGFVRSTDVGLRRANVNESDLAEQAGEFTTSSNNQVVTGIKAPRIVVSHSGCTIEGNRVTGIGLATGNSAIEVNGLDCTIRMNDVGPPTQYVNLNAATVVGSDTCYIDHSDDEFVTTGLPIDAPNQTLEADNTAGTYTYLMFGIETGLMEVYRTVAKTNEGNGIWSYTLERWEGGSWAAFAVFPCSFRWAHPAGSSVAYTRQNVDPGQPSNGIGGGPTTRNYLCEWNDVHTCNDGIKGGGNDDTVHTIIRNTLIRESFAIAAGGDPPHLDGVQGFAVNSGIKVSQCDIIHCTLTSGYQPNSGAKMGDDLARSDIKFSFLNGGRAKILQYGVTGSIKWNRYGLTGEKGLDLTSTPTRVDNLYQFTGLDSGGISRTAGAAVPDGGNTDGGGSDINVWSNGYDADPHWDASYALGGM